jgi:hypothetical protein
MDERHCGNHHVHRISLNPLAFECPSQLAELFGAVFVEVEQPDIYSQLANARGVWATRT